MSDPKFAVEAASSALVILLSKLQLLGVGLDLVLRAEAHESKKQAGQRPNVLQKPNVTGFPWKPPHHPGVQDEP